MEDHHRTGFRNKLETIDNSTLIFMRIHNKKYSEAYEVLSHNGLFLRGKPCRTWCNAELGSLSNDDGYAEDDA